MNLLCAGSEINNQKKKYIYCQTITFVFCFPSTGVPCIIPRYTFFSKSARLKGQQEYCLSYVTPVSIILLKILLILKTLCNSFLNYYARSRQIRKILIPTLNEQFVGLFKFSMYCHFILIAVNKEEFVSLQDSSRLQIRSFQVIQMYGLSIF